MSFVRAVFFWGDGIVQVITAKRCSGGALRKILSQQWDIVRVMETSTAAAGESVSQDLWFCVVLCSVEFAVPQWSLIRVALLFHPTVGDRR